MGREVRRPFWYEYIAMYGQTVRAGFGKHNTYLKLRLISVWKFSVHSMASARYPLEPCWLVEPGALLSDCLLADPEPDPCVSSQSEKYRDRVISPPHPGTGQYGVFVTHIAHARNRVVTAGSSVSLNVFLSCVGGGG